MIALVLRNSLWNGLAHVIGVITGVVGSIIVVNALSPEAYGQFSYYIWLAGILGMLGTLSLPNAVTKITSELRGAQRQEDAESLSYWVFLIILLLNLLLGFGVFLWAMYSALDAERWYLIIIAILLIPNGVAAIARSTLWGNQQYQYVSLVTSVTSVIQLFLLIYVGWSGGSALGFVTVILLSTVLQAAGFFIVIGRQSEFQFRRVAWPPSTLWRHYINFAAPFTIVMIFEVIIWQRSEIFFLERYSNFEQIGFYNLAYTFFGMFLALGWAIVNSYYPAISHDYGQADWEQIRAKFSQGAMIATVFALPITFGGWVMAEQLVVLLYGDKMLAAVPVIRLLLIGLLPGTLAAMMGLTVSAVGGIWFHVRFGFIVSLINISLNFLIIPVWGAVGAAASNTMAQFFNFVLLVVIMHIYYQVNLPWKLIMTVSVLAIGTTYLLPKLLGVWLGGNVGFMLIIFLSVLAYFLSIIWKIPVIRDFIAIRIANIKEGV